MTAAFLKKVVSTDPNSTPYSLDVHNRSISHLDNLNSLPKLRSIDVSFNNLVDLEGLSALPDLRELKAYSCKIQDCYSLGEWCPNLTILLLNDNALAEVPKSFR
jgi:Leucine-rich repeat (LRR) protein